MFNRKSKRGTEFTMTRRNFVRSAGAAAAVAAAGMPGRRLVAEEMPRLSEDDPMAKALEYVHDAGDADTAKRTSGSYCNNCALYTGTVDDEWAGCNIFPGKAVAGKGWCNVWAKKPQ